MIRILELQLNTVTVLWVPNNLSLWTLTAKILSVHCYRHRGTKQYTLPDIFISWYFLLLLLMVQHEKPCLANEVHTNVDNIVSLSQEDNCFRVPATEQIGKHWTLMQLMVQHSLTRGVLNQPHGSLLWPFTTQSYPSHFHSRCGTVNM